MARKPRTTTLATVWISGLDAETGEPFENPVEINIHPLDVPRAIAKWQRIAERNGFEREVFAREYPREVWMTPINPVY